MKINSIEPTTFNAGIKILCNENKGNQYLYNHVLKIARDYKIPATFHTDKIELPSVTKAILEKLNEFKINFSNK
jgi:predicted metal-dependent TIM-barrel fold hydrolase